MPMSDQDKDIHQEVQQVLSQNQDAISFEELPSQQSSPLNQAVVDKDNVATKEFVEESISSDTTTVNEADTTNPPPYKDEPPEQEINEDYSETVVAGEEAPFELPLSHAKQAADTVIGMTNNVLEVGGGYFVKIRKHKDFYEFEELISVIEKQNDKNIKRIKLDKEDQILLRPLLIQVLKTKAQKLTPEQQLMGALLSIGMKKIQIGMEVRSENEILVERILDIIKAEKRDPEEEEEIANKEEARNAGDTTDQEAATEAEIVSETIDQQVMVIPPLNPTIIPPQVMEVAIEHQGNTETSN